MNPLPLRNTMSQLGIVKWFNTKTGFGFIQPLNKSDDIFVHFKHIHVNHGTRKHLTQGEYVQFDTIPAQGDHSVMADHVTGVEGGPLLCETQFLNRRPTLVVD